MVDKKSLIFVSVIYLQLVYSKTVNVDDRFQFVDSCFTCKLSDAADVISRCGRGITKLHCLEDEAGLSGLVCAEWKWIQTGRCPYYNTYQGNLDEKDCNATLGKCPTEMIKSYTALLYPGCYQQKPEESTTLQSVDKKNEERLKTNEPKEKIAYLMLKEDQFEILRSAGDLPTWIIFLLLLASVVVISKFAILMKKKILTKCDVNRDTEKNLNIYCSWIGCSIKRKELKQGSCDSPPP